MALKGNLRDFKIEEIMTFINAGKKSGAFEVKKGPDTVIFYFRQGNLYYIYNSRNPVSVTEQILKSGILDEETVKEIKTGKKYPLDSVQVSEKQAEAIKEILLETLCSIAAEVFSWEEGEFIFKAGEKRSGEDWGLSPDYNKFLSCCRKRADVFKKFSKYARDLNRKLYFNADINDDDVILTSKEWRFISNMRPGSTPEEVARNSGLTVSMAIQVATSLLEKGLIVVKEIEEPEKPEEVTEAPSKIEEPVKVEEAVKEIEEQQKKEEVVETEDIEEKIDLSEDYNLIDELAALTTNSPGETNLSPDTKAELENILKSLKEL